MAILSNGSSGMENRKVPIVCSQEKSNTQVKGEKMKARMNVMNAIQDAKKLEFEGDIGKSEEMNSGRINVWGNKNSCSVLFGDDAEIFNGNDSQVIRVKDDDEKFEVSLDTSQYRQDEVKVNVIKGMICVEGKHEEKSEDGKKMVSRQFSRKYSLPFGAKPQHVASNLSSDGVLVITFDKKSLECQSRSLENKFVEKSEDISRNERVATNLRSNFLTDPFFKNSWDNLENVHHQIRKTFCDTLERKQQTSTNKYSSQAAEQNNNIDPRFLNQKRVNQSPKPWMLPALPNNFKISTFDNINGDLISQTKEDGILEWKIDISGYEQREVKVIVSQGKVIIEGNREERSIDGKQSCSKSFIRKYSVPKEVKQSDVKSEFTSDHALIVSVQKQLTNQQLTTEKGNGQKSSDKAPIDVWSSFEHNYNDAGEDDYLNLNEMEKSTEKTRTNIGLHNVKIEQIDKGVSSKVNNTGMKACNNNYKTEESKGHRNVKIVQDIPSQLEIISESYNHKPNISVEIHNDSDNMDVKEGAQHWKKVASAIHSKTNKEQKYRNAKIEQDIDKEQNKNPEGDKNPINRKVKITKKIEDNLKESTKSECLNKGIKYRNVPIETCHKVEENKCGDSIKETKSNYNCKTNILKKAEDAEQKVDVIHVPINQSLHSGNNPNFKSNHSKQKLKQEDICLYNVSMDRVSSPELTNVKVIHQSTLPESIIVPEKKVSVERERETFNDSSLFAKTPQDFYPEKYRLPSNLTKKLNLFQTEDDQVIRLVNNQDKFEVSLDTSHYRSDELKIWMKDKIIFVDGKHEEQSEDGKMIISRQFSKKFNLPAEVNPENVTTNLSSDGVLVITGKKQNFQSQEEASMNRSNKNSGVHITMRNHFLDDPFFKSTWSDIDNIKESIFNQSSSLWKEWEENSLLNDKSMISNHQCFIDEIMETYEEEEKDWIMPRKWMIPSMFTSDFNKHLDPFATNDSEIIRKL